MQVGADAVGLRLPHHSDPVVALAARILVLDELVADLVSPLRRRLEPSAQVEATSVGGAAPGTRNAGAITDAVRVLARRAQYDVTAPAAAAGTPAAAPTKRFADKTFVSELQLYLLGRTGMALDINNVRVTAAAGRSVVPTVTIGTVEVEDVILRWLPTDSEPWNEVMRRTWPTTDETSSRKQAASRLINRAVEPPTGVTIGGSAPRVWDGNEFKFRDAFKQQVEDTIRPTALTANDLPAWQSFINTSDTTEKAGIRLNTHREFTSGSTWNLSGNQRNSHHTTQFLVAEYFHNKSDFKPVSYTHLTLPTNREV